MSLKVLGIVFPLTLVAIISVPLFGCAQMQNARNNQEIKAGVASCNQRIESDAALAPLRGKLQLLASDQMTIPMLADTHKAGQEEQNAILALDHDKLDCFNSMYEKMKGMAISAADSEFLELYRESAVDGQHTRAELYQDHITFGEANQMMQASETKYQQRLVELRSRAQATRHAANAVAIQALTPLAQQPSVITPAYQPHNMSCVQNGAFTNCRGY